MKKCSNQHCEQPADPDVSSQGYCLRCVSMWIAGVDPILMMSQAIFMDDVKRQREALRQIRDHDESQAYDPTMWNNREQYLDSVVKTMKQKAEAALEARKS